MHSYNTMNLGKTEREYNSQQEEEKLLLIERDQIVKSVKNDTYAGKFYQSLATAIKYADLHNLRKIQQTFPNFWNEYSDR